MQIAVFKLFREYPFTDRKGDSSQLNMWTVKILKSKVILLSVIPNKFYCFLRKNTNSYTHGTGFAGLRVLCHATAWATEIAGFNSFPVIFVKCYLRNC